MCKLISKESKHYYRTLLAILFIAAGYIIAAISVFVSSYYQLNAIDKEFEASAKTTLAHKKEFIQTQTNNFKNYIAAIDENSRFKSFLESDTKALTAEKEHIKSLMMAVSRSDSNIMQFRFIGKDGYEAIRIDRGVIAALPYAIETQHLQNKADRYYFQKTKAAIDKIWFSNIDLNMEYGKIVKPIVPTLRIAKPYYKDGEFKGILIINIFMEKILDEIMESELFHVTVIDKDLNILTTSRTDYKEDSKEWTKYFGDAKKINYEIDKSDESFIINMLFQKKYTSAELSDIIQNSEELKIVLEEKTEKLIEHTDDILEYMLVMIAIVFLISFPIVAILSSYPLKLHDELEKYKDDLENQMEIIDRYVYMTSTDTEGIITNVSEAYTKLSGYTKEELIGKKHSILKDPTVPKSFYKNMWVTILNGENWSGEIKNISKDGKVFVIKSHIAPMLENNDIVGFTSIRENITDQKIVENLSIKDELTQCYNRRFFNQIFPKELKRARRKDDIFCIAMFDIDYFKRYNDTYGHIKGDEVLQAVVKQVSSKLQRVGDYLFRIGGEEFIVIFSDVKSFEEAQRYSVELVMGVENLEIEHIESLNDNVVTISLGLIAVTPACTRNKDEILKRIDELLYSAKDSGRNRVVSERC